MRCQNTSNTLHTVRFFFQLLLGVLKESTINQASLQLRQVSIFQLEGLQNYLLYTMTTAKPSSIVDVLL